MGTRINPCFGCPLREGCQQREVYRKKVRKLAARVVEFTCPILAKRIRKGARVVIRASRIVSDWTGEPQLETLHVPATITATRPGHAFACTVDPGQGVEDRYRFRRFQKHTRILELLEESRAVCDVGNVQQPDIGCDRGDGECICRWPLPRAASEDVAR